MHLFDAQFFKFTFYFFNLFREASVVSYLSLAPLDHNISKATSMLDILHRRCQNAQMPSTCLSDSSNASSTPKKNVRKTMTPANPEQSKQKIELCRQFMECGYCPYDKRCKFAHGLHELLRNQEPNTKYKTKICDNFKRNMCCMYGNRCNFIHQKEELPKNENQSSDVEMGMIRSQRYGESRLLTLLK